jgi:hypothetical protein
MLEYKVGYKDYVKQGYESVTITTKYIRGIKMSVKHSNLRWPKQK